MRGQNNVRTEKNSNKATLVDWSKWECLDGWLTRSEGELLYRLAGSAKGAIVEIGSWKGKSTICLASGAPLGTKIVAIDPHVGSADHQAMSAGKIWTFDQFKENLKAFGIADRVTPIVDFSQNVAKTWQEPIGLLFIDGAHDESSVLADFQLFWPYVRQDAWVVMHDTTGTWNLSLSGWKGPRKIADKYLFGSSEIGAMCVVDSITAGQRVGSSSFLSRVRKVGIRICKIPSDILSIIVTAGQRLPAPVKRSIRCLLPK